MAARRPDREFVAEGNDLVAEVEYDAGGKSLPVLFAKGGQRVEVRWAGHGVGLDFDGSYRAVGGSASDVMGFRKNLDTTF